MRDQRPPEKGDLVSIEWVDISEDSSGDPDTGDLAHRTSIGFFWRQGTSQYGLPIVVTTTTIEGAEDQIQDSGYCAYPVACILKMTVVKRARRSRGRQEKADGDEGRGESRGESRGA